MTLTRPLNTYIDHTQLKPFAAQSQFEQLLDEAIKFQFASVCVAPYMALPVLEALKVTDPRIKVCTVVDFPLGNSPLALKAGQVDYFAARGVHEIDFVLNYGELKNKNFKGVLHELQTLSDICHQRSVVSKCIVETCYLDQFEKETIFKIIMDMTPNLDFIKTSTGFGSAGAQSEDVQRWNELRGAETRPLIKAAGGIKTLEDALAMINAGADRIGMSSSVQVMEEWGAQERIVAEGEKTVR